MTVAFLLCTAGTVLSLVFFALGGFIVLLAADLLVLYFTASSLVGYVELREKTLFIKFGFFLKCEIAYDSIRRVEKKSKRIYSESIVSMKNALEHIDIRYNTYDVVSVSVTDNDALMSEIEKRRYKK
jgi:hypothetical protein